MLPTSSLRLRLIVILLIPLCVVAAAGGYWRYHEARGISQQLYDKTLLAIALAVSRRVTAAGGDLITEDVLEIVTEYLGDQVFYKVSAADGSFVTGYASGPKVPQGAEIKPGRPLFFDSTFQNDPVRVVVYREFVSDSDLEGWVTTKLWQTTRERAAFARGAALQSLALMLLIILAAGLVIWFGVNRGLRPLLELVNAVEKRSPDDLSSIRRAVPREVTSLVASMNALFAKLNKAFDERDAFIQSAAHQLRNPIAAILSQAEVAEKTTDPVKLRERVGEIAEATRQTSRLTQQLLSMEKASGRVQRSTFDLSKLVADVARSHAPEAMRRGGNFSFNQATQPLLIHGDETMLGEAIDNLIDNAVRYGLRDGGTIEVSVASSDEGRASVRVEDDGPGIPGELRDQIFERFFRVSDADPGGCGLGLAIVSEVAAAHAGDVTVSGTGSTEFTLTLPIASHAAQSAAI